MKIRGAHPMAAAVLAALACGPTGPSTSPTATVSLRYVPSAQPASCTAPDVRECSGGCAHHYAPSNLRVAGSWGQEARLVGCGNAYCGALPAAPVGYELTVLLIDIQQCCRDCSAAVRETVYANGTRLERFVVGEASGLAFVIDRNGVVTP